ncbi:hypothetical protein PoB_007391100 [Plakobranchus ocellatus]|uniref:Reverse transcriptase domain-containing protein n=1 Tax=Plakobranchus ocellatus TaxID=259542 RepID=A0AAV4DTK4_9GAST|nr:hypothetical protein PoB_007391100 [Plakobranchus ocellatus]
MSQLMDDIPGVICDIDDILIMGQTKEQHDSRVREVLNRLISQVKEFCRTGWPANAKKDNQLKRYWTVQHELAINQGIFLLYMEKD